jgi:hypothetical protein
MARREGNSVYMHIYIEEVYSEDSQERAQKPI